MMVYALLKFKSGLQAAVGTLAGPKGYEVESTIKVCASYICVFLVLISDLAAPQITTPECYL